MTIRFGAVLLTALLWAAPAQVTLKPIEKDPIRIDGGLVSGTYLSRVLKPILGFPLRRRRFAKIAGANPSPSSRGMAC